MDILLICLSLINLLLLIGVYDKLNSIQSELDYITETFTPGEHNG